MRVSFLLGLTLRVDTVQFVKLVRGKGSLKDIMLIRGKIRLTMLSRHIIGMVEMEFFAEERVCLKILK